MLQLTGDDPLRQSPQFLKGVGPARLEMLRRLGLATVEDLLWHFPREYEDVSDVRPVSALTAGAMQTVQGEVVEIEGKQLPDGRTLVSVVLSDDGQCLEGVWFNQPYAAGRFRFGQRLAFSGKPQWRRDHWQMLNPRVRPLDVATGTEAQTLWPVYALTEGLRQDQLRPIIRRAVEQFAGHVVDILPPALRQQHGFVDVAQALHDIHIPARLAVAGAARRRFVYEDFLVLQVALALRRRELRDRQRAPALPVTRTIDAHIRRLFPFALTADQDRVIADICRDLAGQRPMQRLLQADVGAGKTAVAVYALLVAVANKYQTVLMAPTEVLAQQHWRTLDRYLERSRVRRLLLTGSIGGRARQEAHAGLRDGSIDLVVGTQALLQEDIRFAQLGLVVIDEQHKFGVNQRARVRRLGVDPHYLVMTATPIPRTVALTVFGDLDLSVIRELPPGRQPVRTRWMLPGQRESVYQRLREGLSQGRQAYVVCPLVSESASLDVRAAEQTFAELRSGPFAEFRVGLIHGGLVDTEKDAVMDRVHRHELDLLVSTTVIEVGVDVPDATMMVIEHAERFGLSQLHQLRGRISRGQLPGECYLFAEPATDEARQRIQVFVRTNDGFTLAERDAELRGLGEFFGTRQHGLGDLRFANVQKDRDVLTLARRDALTLVSADAGLRQPEHQLLRTRVLERYGQTLELAEIG